MGPSLQLGFFSWAASSQPGTAANHESEVEPENLFLFIRLFRLRTSPAAAPAFLLPAQLWVALLGWDFSALEG